MSSATTLDLFFVFYPCLIINFSLNVSREDVSSDLRRITLYPFLTKEIQIGQSDSITYWYLLYLVYWYLPDLNIFYKRSLSVLLDTL